ncbi:MAG: hypothetical protein U0556_09740 [Dehalococcoidia bacterium]
MKTIWVAQQWFVPNGRVVDARMVHDGQQREIAPPEGAIGWAWCFATFEDAQRFVPDGDVEELDVLGYGEASEVEP